MPPTIRQHDHGGLAAELDRDLLHIAGSRLHDEATHFGGSGEGDLVDAGMSREGGAGRGSHARDDAPRRRHCTVDIGRVAQGAVRDDRVA
jgi:hypothetical protein